MTTELGNIITIVAFAGSAVAYVTYSWCKRLRCPNCRIKMKRFEYRNSLGSPVSINGGEFRTGTPRKITKHYKCPKCEKIISTKQIGWTDF